MADQIVEALADEAVRGYGIDRADAALMASKAVAVVASCHRAHRDPAALYLRVTVEAALAGERWARRILPQIRKAVL